MIIDAFRLDGRNALVTGSRRGLGSAMALALAEAGANVMCHGREGGEPAVCEKIREIGRKSAYVAADLADRAACEALIDTTIRQFGSLDILVNNAGITRDKLLRDMSAEDWDAVLNLNLRATFLCSKFATPAMVSKGWGRVINMSSRAHLGNKGQVNYSASKAGVIGFTRSLSMELGKFGVTANCIAPGIIATPGVTSLPHYDRLVERVAPTLPIPRLGKPEDVAGVAAFLASDDAEYITGEVIHVSGGRYG